MGSPTKPSPHIKNPRSNINPENYPQSVRIRANVRQTWIGRLSLYACPDVARPYNPCDPNDSLCSVCFVVVVGRCRRQCGRGWMKLNHFQSSGPKRGRVFARVWMLRLAKSKRAALCCLAGACAGVNACWRSRAPSKRKWVNGKFQGWGFIDDRHERARVEVKFIKSRHVRC